MFSSGGAPSPEEPQYIRGVSLVPLNTGELPIPISKLSGEERALVDALRQRFATVHTWDRRAASSAAENPWGTFVMPPSKFAGDDDHPALESAAHGEELFHLPTVVDELDELATTATGEPRYLDDAQRDALGLSRAMER